MLTIGLVVSRFYDFFTTYLYVTDQEGYVNPVFSVLNLGWIWSSILQIIVIGLLSYAVYIFCFKRVKTIPLTRRHPLWEFIAIFHFGNTNGLIPNNRHALLYAFGGIMPIVVSLISIMVGTSTSLLMWNQGYMEIYYSYNIPAILYLFMLLILIGVSVRFYTLEMKKRLRTIWSE